MDEPKGGPVKPPTLDLKPTKSSRVKPAGSRSGTVRQKQSTSKPGVSARPTSSAKTSGAGHVNPEQASASKPGAPIVGAGNRSFQSRIKGAETIKSGSGSANASADGRVGSAAMGGANGPREKSQSGYLPVAAGAIGKPLLALLILIPLLLSGVFQSKEPQQLQEELAQLNTRLGLNEEQVGTALLNDSTLEGRLNSLMDQMTVDIERLDIMQTNLEGQQNDLAQKVNAISVRQEELLNELNVLSSAPGVEFDPSNLVQEIGLLNQRIDAIDAGASSSDAEKFAADLAQIHVELAALESDISAKSEGNPLLVSKDMLDEKIVELRADILAQTGAIETNQNRMEGLATQLAENATSLLELDNKISGPDISEGVDLSRDSVLVQAPGLALALERAVASGESFDVQLEAYLLGMPGMGVSEELMRRAREGVDTPPELIAAYNDNLPKMLVARPEAPDANWIERFGNSLKSIFAVRTTGERSGNPVDSSLNRLQAALNEGNYEDASYWLGQLPEPMQVASGDVAVQIALLRELGTLLEPDYSLNALSEQNLEGEAGSALPAPSNDRTDIDESAPVDEELAPVESLSSEPDSSEGAQ